MPLYTLMLRKLFLFSQPVLNIFRQHAISQAEITTLSFSPNQKLLDLEMSVKPAFERTSESHFPTY